MKKDLPKVSVIIPARNEEKYIEKCILSLLNNTYPKELLSIYVCDGLSDDNTRSIIERISSKNNNVFLLDNNKQTTPYALNIGLRKSIADVKIILGAHSEVHEDFITENINSLNIDKKIGCAGGVIENVYHDENSKIIGLTMSSPFGVGNVNFRTGNKEGYVDTVAFGAYKKEVFEQIGYFDENLTRNQDDEFNFRLLKNGFKIYLSKSIKCKYYVRGSFNKLFRQYYQYGYWKVFVGKKHKAVTTIRQLIPLLFVLYLIIGAVSSLLIPYALYLYLSIGLIYIFSGLVFAIKLNNNPKIFTKILSCFFILHLSYGSGYLIGILDFLILNKDPNKKDIKMSR